ncbi:MAG: SDR family oxidoreductase [Candidatus Shapirobacteria bacterium]|nr:SDR family oxidoreductase [Candidatus Shapirobacteria bacterium]
MSKNKTILISGGVTGIGAATALKFLEAGWSVAVFSNTAEHNREFLKTAQTEGLANKLLVLLGDITKEKEVKRIVAETKKKFKEIDVLFNNAGLGYFVDADKVDVKKFDEMMEVNVIGIADLTKQVLPIMKKQKSVQIINNASIAGKIGHPKSEFYAATKSAVMRYSEGLRSEVVKYGIKVSVIYTSTVKTGFWNKKEFARRKKENWGGKDPVFLTVQDLARTVDFIVSQPENSVVEEITIMPFGKV